MLVGDTEPALLATWLRRDGSDVWHSATATQRANSVAGAAVWALPTESLPIGARVVFTFYWADANRWEGRDYSVVVTSPE